MEVGVSLATDGLQLMRRKHISRFCTAFCCLLLAACTSSRTALREEFGTQTRAVATVDQEKGSSEKSPAKSDGPDSAEEVARLAAFHANSADPAADVEGAFDGDAGDGGFADGHFLDGDDVLWSSTGGSSSSRTDQQQVQLVSMQDEPAGDQSVSNSPMAQGIMTPGQISNLEPAVTYSVPSLTLQIPQDEVNPDSIKFQQVVDSVYRSYPLLQSALFSRNIALGQQISASGAFDTKLKGASENGAVGFYETYRQSIGVVTPTYWGGEVFAGYRVGRGSFQPWYQERQTNDAGEFKAGVQIPLARNRNIDDRRAELWKAGFGRNLAEPDIQAQLIGFVQESSYAYWNWVAAGEYNSIAERILALAEDRTARIEDQVKAGFIDPPELTDNLRLVAIRQAKVADTRRKLQQSAAKLSVYLRDESGNPLLPPVDRLPGFPKPQPINDDELQSNILLALSQRPELDMLDLTRQQISIDYNNARNHLQPELNAVLWGSQDLGERTSSKGDKSPFESEASLFLDVPLERRKARGKLTEIEGKLAQLSAKRRITEDKIRIDVQVAHAAVKYAWEQVDETQEALVRAEELAEIERENQKAGLSDLLKVTLREQYAVESAEKHVDALKLYFESLADYRAALAQDQIDR